MIGTIIGDICGSYYEHALVEDYNFPLTRDISNFTDDTVLTVATAYSILHNIPYWKAYKDISRFHIHRGFGRRFIQWVESSSNESYNSLGNGSAMRVSPVAYIYNNEEETLLEAKKSAECTHNHPEGIKGAQAIALAIYLARIGADKQTIKERIETTFDYDLNRTVEQIKPNYKFDVTCMGSVPEAIICFLESTDYESAIRKSIYLNGDSDTIAAMSGSIAEAYYKEIPKHLFDKMINLLTPDFLETVQEFYKKYNIETKFV